MHGPAEAFKTEEQVQMMPTVSELRDVTGELSMVRLAGVVATATAPRLYEGRELNKQIVKQTMRSLEARDLQTAREKYLEYVGSARLDRSEPIEDDEQAQAELASDLSDAFGRHVTRTPTRFRTLGDGLRAEEQGRMKRSGDARRTAFHYCRVDRQVCVRRQRDHAHLHPDTDLC